jgi:hypothetical protein
MLSRLVSIAGLLIAVATASAVAGCAATLNDATRHELGGGIGGIEGGKRGAPGALAVLDDSFGWTANYSRRLCQRCESFLMFADVPVIVVPRQEVREASRPVPEGRSDVLILPQARFSVPFGRVALSAGFGGGVARFAEAARLTDGSRHDGRRATRAVVGVSAGGDYRIGRRETFRFAVWAAGPRPDLSFPPVDRDCTRDCGDTLIGGFASLVLRF